MLCLRFETYEVVTHTLEDRYTVDVTYTEEEPQTYVDEYDLALMLQIDDAYLNARETIYGNVQLVATNGKDFEGQLVFIN